MDQLERNFNSNENVDDSQEQQELHDDVSDSAVPRICHGEVYQVLEDLSPDSSGLIIKLLPFDDNRDINSPEDLEKRINPVLAGEELLWSLLREKVNELLIVAETNDCKKAKEIVAICADPLFGLPHFKISIVNMEILLECEPTMKIVITAFTGKKLPLLFYMKRFIGDYEEIKKAYFLKRMDILVNRPLVPLFDIVVVGAGRGAHAAVTALREADLQLNIAVIDWTLPKIDRVTSPGLGQCYRENLPGLLIKEALRRIKDRIAHPQGELTYEILTEIWLENANDFRCHLFLDNFNSKKEWYSLGVQYYRGILEFDGLDYLCVTNESRVSKFGGMITLICGGSIPHYPNFPGIELCYTAENFLFIDKIPKSAIVLGNTSTAFEMATLLYCYGSNVTIMTDKPEWLPGYDRECVEKLIASMRLMGVDFYTVGEILRVDRIDEELLEVEIMVGFCNIVSAWFENVFVDFGTESSADHIALGEAGIHINTIHGKITVDENFNTNNKGIRAFGGLVDGHNESGSFHKAAGKYFAESILGRNPSPPIPMIEEKVINTFIEYACIGETEECLQRKLNEDVTIYELNVFTGDSEQNIAPDPIFYVKFICISCPHMEEDDEKGNEYIIGIHILGREASQLLSSLITPFRRGVTKLVVLDLITEYLSDDFEMFITELTLKYILLNYENPINSQAGGDSVNIVSDSEGPLCERYHIESMSPQIESESDKITDFSDPSVLEEMLPAVDCLKKILSSAYYECDNPIPGDEPIFYEYEPVERRDCYILQSEDDEKPWPITKDFIPPLETSINDIWRPIVPIDEKTCECSALHWMDLSANRTIEYFYNIDQQVEGTEKNSLVVNVSNSDVMSEKVHTHLYLIHTLTNNQYPFLKYITLSWSQQCLFALLRSFALPRTPSDAKYAITYDEEQCNLREQMGSESVVALEIATSSPSLEDFMISLQRTSFYKEMEKNIGDFFKTFIQKTYILKIYYSALDRRFEIKKYFSLYKDTSSGFTSFKKAILPSQQSNLRYTRKRSLFSKVINRDTSKSKQQGPLYKLHCYNPCIKDKNLSNERSISLKEKFCKRLFGPKYDSHKISCLPLQRIYEKLTWENKELKLGNQIIKESSKRNILPFESEHQRFELHANVVEIYSETNCREYYPK